MKKIVVNAIKNIKESILINIIVLLFSITFLFCVYKIIYTLHTHGDNNRKYSKVFQVYREWEDEDVFYFNDYDNTDIKEILYSKYQDSGIKSLEKNIILPATLIIRTMSEYVIVDAYDDYNSFKKNMMREGNIFSDKNNSVIISEYLALKTNEVFQLFIRDTLAGYKASTFFVSGIYSITNSTDDISNIYLSENIIYTSVNAITNFLYTAGSGKNPYFERYILKFEDYKNIDNIIKTFDIDGFIIKNKQAKSDFVLKLDTIHFIFALISLIITYIFVIASLNYMQIQYRISIGYLREYKDISKRSQFMQIFILDFLSIAMYLLFQNIFVGGINFVIFIPILILFFNSIPSILLSVFRKYKYN